MLEQQAATGPAGTDLRVAVPLSSAQRAESSTITSLPFGRRRLGPFG